jgi:hypothetical protein
MTPASVEEKLSMPVAAGPYSILNGNLFKYSPFLRGEKPPFLPFTKRGVTQKKMQSWVI